MKKKKIVSILLTLVMVLTLIPSMAVTSQAASYDPSPSWILIGNHDGIKKSETRNGMQRCALLWKRTVRHISVW